MSLSQCTTVCEHTIYQQNSNIELLAKHYNATKESFETMLFIIVQRLQGTEANFYDSCLNLDFAGILHFYSNETYIYK